MQATAGYMKQQTALSDGIGARGTYHAFDHLLRRLFGTDPGTARITTWFSRGSKQADLLLPHLIISAFAVVGAMVLLSLGAARPAPNNELATISQQVRVAECDVQGQKSALERRTLAKLGRAKIDGPCVQLWDMQGRFLTQITMDDPKSRDSLPVGRQYVERLPGG